MGACLYIKDKKIFEDSYNSCGLFSVIAATNSAPDVIDFDEKPYLSWWETYEEYKDWFVRKNRDLVMTIEGVKQWKDKIVPELEEFISKETIFYPTNESVKNNRILYDLKSLNDLSAEKYRKWAKRLIDFIDFAVKNNFEIIWSI